MESERLVSLRKKLGLSQREMARELGATPGALAMWENRSRPIPGPVLRLMEVYEEYLGAESRGRSRQKIHDDLRVSFDSILQSTLSKSKFKRQVQVALFNRAVEMASRSKGLPMKIIQLMTYLRPSMSEEARRALLRIHRLHHPMAPTMIARILYEDFGQSPSRMFAEWSPKPIASASIGQVHKARLHTGEDVVVKIQYPGVRESLDHDLDTLRMLTHIATFLKADLGDVAGPLAETIRKETDYYQEMDALEAFHELFKGDSHVLIPKVHRKFSNHRVITMDYIEGMSLEDFKKTASDEIRKSAAETLARFATVSTFRSGLINSDTHAENFIFRQDGRVGFIDFGRTLPVPFAKQTHQLMEAVLKQDERVDESLITAVFRVRKGRNLDVDGIWKVFLKQQRHLHSGEFRFSYDHIEKCLDMNDLKPFKDDLRISFEAVWSTAVSLGLWSVLVELDVPVDYGAISRRILFQ